MGVAEAYRALHVDMSAKMSNASILVCQGHISMIFEIGFLWGLGPLEGHLGGGGAWGGPRPKSGAIDFAEEKLKKDTCGVSGSE